MKRNISLLFLGILAALLAGCGGGNSSKINAAGGRAVLTVKWPLRSRLLPQAANSIKVSIKNGNTLVTSRLLARPASGTTTSVTFDPLPVGTLAMTATAFPVADGTGIAQATGGAALNIQAGQTFSFALTMQSTITKLDVTASNPNIKIGNTQQMTATATDASGAIVLLTPSKLQWLSSNTAAATVDAAGLVKALAVGNSDISVKDTESNLSGKLTITVSIVPPITFQAPSLINMSSPGPMVTADFDGDGKIDIVIGSPTTLYILYGNGDGTFQPAQTILTWSGEIRPYSSLDMNGDGRPDIVCTVPNQFVVINNLGSRHFAAPAAVALGNTALGPLAVGDFNGDGKPDVAIIAFDHPGGTQTDIFIYRNEGSDTFTKVSTLTNTWIVLTIRVGDLNGDGKQDLLVNVITDIVGTSGAGIYLGDGTGNFTGGPGVQTESGNTDWTTIADFNGDGKLDYAVANDYSGSLSVVYNTGGGSFATPATYACNSYPDILESVDLDGDGAIDIIAENRDASFVTVLRNQKGLFQNAVQIPIGGQCTWMNVVDLNGDGKPDILVSSRNTNNICVVLNNTP